MSSGRRLAERHRAVRKAKCHHCGGDLDLGEEKSGPVAADATCPSCDSAVHACRNCLHFAPDVVFECRKSVKQTYRKAAANDCAEFEPRATVELTREQAKPEPARGEAVPRTSSVRPRSRRAFEDLFKDPS